MVVLEYKNGDKYDGDISDEKRNGHGKLTYKNGGKYEGEWVDDKRHGQGVNVWANGDRYSGSWKENKKHGQGTFIYSDGGKYVGEWQEDQRHGQGVNIWSNGNQYEGDWVKNRRHGKGTLIYSDGGRYVGDWVKGLRHGKGVNTWANGDRYEGLWEQDQRQGKGVMHHADGSREEKEWKDAEKNNRVALNAEKKDNNAVGGRKPMKFDLRWIDGRPAIVMLMTKPSSDVCPYLSLARELVVALGWNPKFFNSRFDRCYCGHCYKENYVDILEAGEGKYVIPRGWVRLGLTIDPVIAETEEIWKKWIVTFHGTTKVAALSILTHRQFCWPGDVLIDGTKLEIRKGHIPGQNYVYTSPTISYSSHLAYSPVYSFHSKEHSNDYYVQIVLQCRQKPGTFKVGPETVGAGAKRLCPHITNDKIEYFTDRRATIIVYGFLVRFREKSN